MLVARLLELDPGLWDEITGWEENEDGYRPEIFQWLAFPDGTLWREDYENLAAAGVPVLDTDLGTWVGITSWGSHYDLYVYPALISALFGVPCNYQDICELRQ